MKDNVRHVILRDAFGAIAFPASLYLAGDLVEQLIAVYSAGVLAAFADSVLRLDIRNGGVSLAKLALCVALTVLAAPALGLLAENTDLKYALRLDRRILSRFFAKKYDNALKIDVGEAEQRLENDIIELRCGLRQILENAVLIPAILAYLLYSALSVSPAMTVVIFAVSVIKLAVPLLTAKMKARYAEAGREYGDGIRSLEMSITSRPADVRLFGLGRHMISEFDRLFGRYYSETLKRSIPRVAAADAVSGFIGTFCTAVLLVSGALMAASGMISAGEIAAMIGWYGVFGTVFEKTGEIITAAPDIRNLVSRLTLIYDGSEKEGGVKISGFETVAADNVSYSYSGGDLSLKPISFSLSAGDRISVTGPNGSGKSTLVSILCGLLADWRGGISVDGADMKDIDPVSWRRLTAYAPQDPYLFAGTVRDNIRLGGLSASEEETDAVISRLGLGDIAGRRAGEGGDELSGGERQRISIARALMKKAPILLLDEPSNNLDADGIGTIIEIIKGYDGAVVFVSHLDRLTAAGGGAIRLS